MTAKHMVSQNTRKSCRLEKRKRGCVPFLLSKPKPKKERKKLQKERKYLAVNRQQSLLRAAKVLFTTKTNGYRKSKNINANQIRVKSSRLKLVHSSRSKIRLEEAEEERLEHRRCPPAPPALAFLQPAWQAFPCKVSAIAVHGPNFVHFARERLLRRLLFLSWAYFTKLVKIKKMFFIAGCKVFEKSVK